MSNTEKFLEVNRNQDSVPNTKITKQHNFRARGFAVIYRSMFIVSLLSGIVIWAALSVLLPKDVASPVSVSQALGTLMTNGTLPIDIAYSVVRVAVGFTVGLVLAIPVAFALNAVRGLRNLLDPWIQFFRVIPPIALIPLVIVFFGIGETAKVSVIFFAVFLTVLITTYQGIRMIDATLIRAARVLGTSGWRLFAKVIVPAAVPSIFTGARLGIASGWTTLVAAELIAASHGLGFMITQASQYFDLPAIYLGIITIGVIGFIFDRLLLRVERRMISWADVG
jgi:NitT/TauT family transport system permease protein